MKSFSVITDRNVSECITTLINNIELRPVSDRYLAPTLTVKEKMIGNIHDNELWMLKENTRLNIGFRRAFIGKISENNDVTVIAGKFSFPMVYKIIYMIFLIGYLAIPFFTNGTLYVLPYILVLASTIIFPILIILLHKKQERDVMEFLHSL